jgi:hypothetical protein
LGVQQPPFAYVTSCGAMELLPSVSVTVTVVGPSQTWSGSEALHEPPKQVNEALPPEDAVALTATGTVEAS